MDQVVQFSVPGRGFDQLPPDPRRGSHLEMDQLATAVADEEEDVEGLEGESLGDEEVGRPDRLRVIGQERAPALAGWAGVKASTIAAYRAGADDDAELEELATDALGAPRAGSGWPWWRSTHGSRASIGSGLDDGLSASASRGASLGGCQRRTVSGRTRTRCRLQAG